MGPIYLTSFMNIGPIYEYGPHIQGLMNWGCIISLAVHFSSLAGFMNIGPVYLAL